MAFPCIGWWGSCHNHSRNHGLYACSLGLETGGSGDSVGTGDGQGVVMCDTNHVVVGRVAGNVINSTLVSNQVWGGNPL